MLVMMLDGNAGISDCCASTSGRCSLSVWTVRQRAALPLGLSGFKAAVRGLNKVLLETGVGGGWGGQAHSAAASGCRI